MSKPRRQASIVRRIMFMSWLIAIVTAVAFAAATIYTQNRTIRTNLEEKALRVAGEVSAQMRDALQTGTGEFPDVSGRDGELDYVALTTRRDSRLYRSGSGTSKNWPRAELFGELWFPDSTEGIDGKAVVVDNPLNGIGKALQYREAFYHEGKLLGWIHVGTSMEGYHQSLEQVYTLTGSVALTVIAFSALISFFFARQITKPIRALQTYAQSVSAGALNARVTVNSNDEIQDLAESLNRMVENLQSSQHKLKDTMEAKHAMREQEILLREIHHRVKNNMQILTSLLRLQTRRAESEQLRTVLRESEARIRSMGLLHEKLYQSESVSEIDIAGYLQTLTSELVRMNTPQGEKREIRLAVRGIKMGLDTALPCGLIITELVSNSLKYAFPAPGQEGVILISLGRTNEGEYTLVVWDNGVGLPTDYKQRQSKSLGTRLVTMLTDQLNGTLEITGERGTRTEIKFKESQYQKRI